MKNTLLAILLLTLIFRASFAQNKVLISAKVYDVMKKEGALKKNINYVVLNDDKGSVKTPSTEKPQPHNWKAPRSSACGCMVPIDGTFSVAEFNSGTAPDYRNDDGSTAAKTLPFNFCFYGSSYNSVYINNNGNISFGNAIGAFSAGGFPAGSTSSTANDTIMIAPFWADVDTRDPASGLVYYKITPTYMIVRWDHVGYYSNHSDKLDDFQVIISDGSNSILSDSNNVSFCYGDMQWTTGDASGGTGGFGGTPANAGINKGDGINYVQIGRFDQTGAAYDGPVLNNDGVDFLDNYSALYNTCVTNNNLPPSLNPTISLCDSFKICNTTDTLIYTLRFTGPEAAQNITSITATAPTLGPNFTILSTSYGTVGVITFRVIASAALVGSHSITITATDDGVPSENTVVTFNVPIIAGTPPPDPLVIVNPTIICANSGTATFALTNPTDYDSYIWSNGSNNDSIFVSDNNVYYLTVNKNGCYKTIFDSVQFKPAPTPLILGPLAICGGAQTTLYVDSASLYPSISWTTGSTNDSVNVSGGTYSVTVTDASGCTATSPSVTVTSSSLNITGATTFCQGDSVLLTANANPAAGAVYTWSNSASTSTIYADTTGSYYATVNYPNGCMISDTINVFSIPFGVPNTTFSYNTPVCKLGANPTIIASSAFTPGGTFSSSAGLSINSSTGTINLASSSTGTYNVTYNVPASACGPAGSSTATIKINPPSASTLGFSYHTVCANDTNQFPLLVPGFDSGGVFSSTTGLSIVDSTGEIILAQSTPGTYTITYTLPDDTTLAICRTGGSSTAAILINALPSINLTSDQVIWIGNSVTLIAQTDTVVSHIWTPGIGLSCTNCDTTIANPTETQRYCFTVMDTIGCVDSSCVKVDIEIPCLTNTNLEVPNAFTPNGDGYNDELCLHGWNDCVDKFLIVIYDRWGEMVYQSTDPDFCWNGIYKGELLNSGVFMYFIKATFIVSGDTPLSSTSKNEVNRKGNITIVH